jgi:hypothetical protein
MGSSAALVTEIVDYRGHFIFNASGPERTLARRAERASAHIQMRTVPLLQYLGTARTVLPKAISWSGGVRLSFGSLNLVCGERPTKAWDSLRASC